MIQYRGQGCESIPLRSLNRKQRWLCKTQLYLIAMKSFMICIHVVFQNCSDFQAGNIIRSKKKTANLDITGLFGSVCQHDIPQLFLNLKHGER